MKTLDQALADALDARRDPLVDEDVLAALVVEPERFDEVARVSDRLALVRPVLRPVSRPVRRTTRRAVPIALAAAAALAIVATALLWNHDASHERERVDTDTPLSDSVAALPTLPTPLAEAPVSGRERITSLVLSLEESSTSRSEITTLRIDANGERKLERRAARLTPNTDFLTLSTEERYP